ncbi:hypothetical protein [uncultured Pseudoalteromonas sp.]|uniref:lipopolysaccharide biosynthesis protein n=1 Tax=uncultured Pseudoalteromonas sp. TaxID=114053 RepID=UPI0032B184E8
MNFITILGKTSIISIFSSCITYFSYFYLAANAFNDDFGSFTYLQSLMLLLINIMPFGSTMAVVVFRFNIEEYSYFQLINERIIILMPVVFIFVSFVAALLSNYKIINVEFKLFLCVVFICFSNSVSLVVMGYYRVSQKFMKYGVLFLVYTIVNSLFFVFNYFNFESLNEAFYCNALLSFSFSLFCYYSMTRETCKVAVSNGVFNRFVVSAKYGLPIVLSSLTMSFLVVGDKIILGGIAPEMLKSYGVAALISSTTLFLVNNFASSWGAFLVKKCSTENNKVLFYYKSNIPKLFLIIPIALIAFLAQYFIYIFFYADENPNIFPIVIILTSAYLVFGLSKFFMGYMNFFKKNVAVFLSSIIGVFGVFFVAFQMDGMQGMALSILLGMILQLLFCIFYTNKLLKGI